MAKLLEWWGEDGVDGMVRGGRNWWPELLNREGERERGSSGFREKGRQTEKEDKKWKEAGDTGLVEEDC